MTYGLNEEKVAEILKEMAARRFGGERAGLLEPAIQEIAQSLTFIARQEVALEEEPDFFK